MKRTDKQKLIQALAEHRDGLKGSLEGAVNARPYAAVTAAFGVGALLGAVGSVRLVSDVVRGALVTYSADEM